MNRRAVIKNLLVASGGMVALPAWAREWSVGNIPSGSVVFTATEQQLLASVADTIIPADNAIGALSVEVDKFLVRLFSDCYEKEVQDNIKSGLETLEKSAKKKYNKSFTDCSQLQRQELLLRFSTSVNKAEKDFFDLVKGETIRGFSTSREVMVNYHQYKVAPARYKGCVDVKT